MAIALASAREIFEWDARAAATRPSHVHFTSRLTNDQFDRAEAAYTVIVALERDVAAAEAQ